MTVSIAKLALMEKIVEVALSKHQYGINNLVQHR